MRGSHLGNAYATGLRTKSAMKKTVWRQSRRLGCVDHADTPASLPRASYTSSASYLKPLYSHATHQLNVEQTIQSSFGSVLASGAASASRMQVRYCTCVRQSPPQCQRSGPGWFILQRWKVFRGMSTYWAALVVQTYLLPHAGLHLHLLKGVYHCSLCRAIRGHHPIVEQLSPCLLMSSADIVRSFWHAGRETGLACCQSPGQCWRKRPPRSNLRRRRVFRGMSGDCGWL